MDLVTSSAVTLPVPARYVLPFLDKHRETPTATTFRFATKGTGFRYLSNQAIRLGLPGVNDPWGPVRLFSLSSSPSELGFISITSKMTGSPYKEALNHLKEGDRAVVAGPFGDLIYDASRPALFLAGGIGVTPFRGMLRYAVDTGARQPVILLYSARVPEEFAFRKELDALAQRRETIRIYYTVTRPQDSDSAWTGRTGRIDEAWIREMSQGLEDPKIYVVGLPEMVEDSLLLLRDKMKVAEEDLEYEFFRGY